MSSIFNVGLKSQKRYPISAQKLLSIIPRARVGYEVIDSQRGA